MVDGSTRTIVNKQRRTDGRTPVRIILLIVFGYRLLIETRENLCSALRTLIAVSEPELVWPPAAVAHALLKRDGVLLDFEEHGARHAHHRWHYSGTSTAVTNPTSAARSTSSYLASELPKCSVFNSATRTLFIRAAPILARWISPARSCSGRGKRVDTPSALIVTPVGGSTFRMTSVAVTAPGGTSISDSSSIPRPQRESVRRRFALVSAFIIASARDCPCPLMATAPIDESLRPLALVP